MTRSGLRITGAAGLTAALALTLLGAAAPSVAGPQGSVTDAETAALRAYLGDPPLVLAQSDGPSEGGLIIIPTDPPLEEPPPVADPLDEPVPPDAVIEFDKPIGVGPVPINGHSIAELIQGEPLFPPIEGLDPTIWQKHCDNCHQWNKERLCDQAKTYVGIGESTIFRLAHPYGAPFKVALARWARDGCR